MWKRPLRVALLNDACPSPSRPLVPLLPGQLPTNLGSVEVVAGGFVSARAVRSANPPSARLVSPRGGSRYGAGGLSVEWNAADADPGAALFVSLDYSADGGTSW